MFSNQMFQEVFCEDFYSEEQEKNLEQFKNHSRKFLISVNEEELCQED